jgi:hypothetical protein
LQSGAVAPLDADVAPADTRSDMPLERVPAYNEPRTGQFRPMPSARPTEVADLRLAPTAK